jgi:ornithine carbamoyltransferase
MADRPPKRDFLAITDFSREELLRTLALAETLRAAGPATKPLAGKSLAMIAFQLGAHALFLSARDIQLGRGEPIRDTARVLSRYVDGIMIRTFAHEEVEELARFATVPVINGLTDLLHPCQVLADLLTLRQSFGPELQSLKVAWIGDGNNMANSWINAALRLGFELRLACPDGYDPDPAILERARSGAKVTLVRDPQEAVQRADVVTTDVWASMGQEEEAAARAAAFQRYRVDDALMGRASRRAIFLHCLPAHRGEEVTEEVLEGPRSRVFDEAENRLHAQKAVMTVLMGEERFAL